MMDAKTVLNPLVAGLSLGLEFYHSQLLVLLYGFYWPIISVNIVNEHTIKEIKQRNGLLLVLTNQWK